MLVEFFGHGGNHRNLELVRDVSLLQWQFRQLVNHSLLLVGQTLQQVGGIL